jgi:hypothetical protein
MWVGFYLLMALIVYLILYFPSRNGHKIKNDADALQIGHQTLEEHGVEPYELVSIIRMDEINTTTIMVETKSFGISIELDNKTGKVLSMERLVM